MSDLDTISTRARTPRRGRRLTVAGGTAVVGALLLAGCYSANQSKMMKLVNDFRKANSKSTLAANDKAMKKAQDWSAHMAATGVLEHTGGGSKLDPSGLPKQCAMGETVTKAASIEAAQNQFVHSTVHRGIELGNWTNIGTGVVRKGSDVWVTVIYYRAC